jgi:hypothetical protein
MKRIEPPTKDVLYDLYVTQNKFADHIRKEFGVSNPTLKKWLTDYEIPLRSIGESNKRCHLMKGLDITADEYNVEKLSTPQIAQRHGVTTEVVRKRLKELGVEFRSRKEAMSYADLKKFKLDDPDQVLKDYCDGTSISTLSKTLNVPFYLVRNHVKKSGVLRSRKDAGKLAVIEGSKTKMERYGYAHYPDIKTSAAENEIRSFLASIGGNFVTDRTVLGNGLELDGYDAKLKLAFEFCGVYWHSEIFKDKNYHFKKMKACEDKGIRLLTIFEDEWVLRKEPIKGYLRSILGNFDKRYFARKTTTKAISNDEAKQFCTEFHIQGSNARMLFAVGLFNANELIGVMTFGEHHRSQQDSIILSRLVFKSGVQVVGGASKLLAPER